MVLVLHFCLSCGRGGVCVSLFSADEKQQARPCMRNKLLLVYCVLRLVHRLGIWPLTDVGLVGLDASFGSHASSFNMQRPGGRCRPAPKVSKLPNDSGAWGACDDGDASSKESTSCRDTRSRQRTRQQARTNTPHRERKQASSQQEAWQWSQCSERVAYRRVRKHEAAERCKSWLERGHRQ